MSVNWEPIIAMCSFKNVRTPTVLIPAIAGTALAWTGIAMVGLRYRYYFTTYTNNFHLEN